MNSKDSNIQSNLIFIIGGLKEHKSQNKVLFNKYGITHILRQIDDYKEYPPTIELKQLCKEFGIDKFICDEVKWTAATRRMVNRMLKEKKHSDTVQIEHVSGGIKGVVEKDEVMSFLSAKNNTTFIINKLISSMGGLHLENKVKVFLGYLLINMVFDDMLPLLAMTKKEDIVVKKKVVEGDKTTYVEDKKTINFNLNKLHPCVVKNVLTRTITA